MDYAKALVCTAALIAAPSCTTINKVPTSKLGSATFVTANGSPAGKAFIAAAGDEVTINLAVVGLPQGMHGIHLHMVGSCETPGFSSAGPHLNPDGHQHGTQNPAGSHLGDLPNLSIDKLGAGTLVAALRGSRISIEAALFDTDGTAIVIHADPDDNKTDPSGNSGARIACGVLKRG